MFQPEFDGALAAHRFFNMQLCKEQELNDIVKLAAQICGTPIGIITFVDGQTHYIKFRYGTDLSNFTLDGSFCSFTVQQNNVLVVEDARHDERFEHYPLVTGPPYIGFYAGVTLTTIDGYTLGTLSVIDTAPNKIDSNQQQILMILGKQVINLMEFDLGLKMYKQQYTEAKNSETKLKSFFESSSSCHVLIDKNLDILAYNRAFENFIYNTYKRNVATGMNATDLLFEPYLTYFIENFNKALQGITTEVERRIDYDGKIIWWNICYEPARNEEGDIIGLSFNATDITKRVEQQEKVVEQNESLRKIAYLHSHELRRPVASIMGLMHLIKSENYTATTEELMMMEKAVDELDEKIRTIIGHTN